MAGFIIRKGRRADAEQFLGLVRSLAEFEKLEPPSPEGRRRLAADVFRKKRIRLLVAADGVRLVGYALYFFVYSSFLAKPTLYLEDLFVLPSHRNKGIGFALFRRCVNEAVSKGCGRMEWAVLTWNSKAIEFYDRLGAKRMSEWHLYRLDEGSLAKIPKQMT